MPSDLLFFALHDGRSVFMSGKTEVAKGRIKEAAGVLTDNDELRAEGRTDQAVGKARDAVHQTVRKIKKIGKALRAKPGEI